MSEVIGESVLAEWLARLKQGREWQRQAGQMNGWEDLIGGGLLNLVSEAATGERPSERDISLLLGVKPALPRINGRAAGGVSQHFNDLSRRVPARRGGVGLASPRGQDWPAGTTEDLAPTVWRLPEAAEASAKIQNVAANSFFDKMAAGSAEEKPAGAAEKALQERPAKQPKDRLKNEEILQDKENLRNKKKLWGKSELTNSSGDEIGVAETAPGKAQIEMWKQNDISFEKSSDLGAVVYAGELTTDRPELMFYSDLGEDCVTEPRLAAVAENLAAEIPTASLATLIKPAAKPLGAETDADRLADLVAERLREDIEALLASASLV